jgi:hypothetical protein
LLGPYAARHAESEHSTASFCEEQWMNWLLVILVFLRQRHRIAIMFGILKDWRRIAMCYDRCAQTSFSAITLTATVIVWLGQ